MTNPEFQQGQMRNDLGDCRQLPSIIFNSTGVGTQTDFTYVPLSRNNVDVFSRHFLRFTVDYNEGVSGGGVEVVEKFAVDGSENRIMKCYVNSNGKFEFRVDSEVLGPELPIDWPVMLDNPQVLEDSQIGLCLRYFQYADDEMEIDPESLRKELLLTQSVFGPYPHIRIRDVKGIELDGYEINLLHKSYSMPKDLADSIGIDTPTSEWLEIEARCGDEPVLDETLVFDGKGRIVSEHLVVEDLVKCIGAVASFKRAVFDR
ncbi:MAG: hypothetical protein AAB914_01345 [Patescibacteria group bacterium]